MSVKDSVVRGLLFIEKERVDKILNYLAKHSTFGKQYYVGCGLSSRPRQKKRGNSSTGDLVWWWKSNSTTNGRLLFIVRGGSRKIRIC